MSLAPTPPPNPSGPAAPMAFWSAVRSGLTVWTMKGRASRSEYWYLVIGLGLTNLVLRLFLAAAPSGARTTLEYLIDIAIFVIAFKVLVRRYHDIGHSGRWLIAQYAAEIVGYIMIISGAASMYGLSISQLMHRISKQTPLPHTVGGSGVAVLLIGALLLFGSAIWFLVWATRAPRD